MNDDILITGAAGFIGYHVARRLLEQGRRVVGVDSLNSYYNPALKAARRAQLEKFPAFRFLQINLTDRAATTSLFSEGRFPIVIHLAAQAGVRYSLEDPHAYIDANLYAFTNVLEGCRRNECRHLLFASSSSVYGSNTQQPFSTHQNVDHPVSLYGATKKANELMSHAYAHLYDLPTTGMRFFTVYGPWGRPDMAMWIFAASIAAGKPIPLFNHGKMKRDFTFVEDASEAVIRLIDHVPARDPAKAGGVPDPASSAAPWRIINIGSHAPVDISLVVELLETAFGRTVSKELLPMQPGDVPSTYADVAPLFELTGFQPTTPIEEGVKRFVSWYRAYHSC